MQSYFFVKNINFLKKKRDSLLKRMKKINPFIEGSLVIVRRRCGNKNCKCFKRGEKHRGYYLMYKEKKKTKGVYIPVDKVEEVKGWAEEYKRLKRLIKEVSEVQKEIIKRYVKEKRQKGGRV